MTTIKFDREPNGDIHIEGDATLKDVFDITSAVVQWFCIAFYAEGISQNSLCKQLVEMVMKATNKYKPKAEEDKDAR